MNTRTWIRIAVLAAPAAAGLVVFTPAAAQASWNDGHAVGTDTQTGQLGFTADVITGGSWADAEGDAFDPASDSLAAGQTLIYSVSTSVTAVGDNLTASIRYDSGAGIPAEVSDSVSVSLTTQPGEILGSKSDAAGAQPVELDVHVAADDTLSAAATLDLRTLTITLSNGEGWSDSATIDAGQVDTAFSAAGGKMVLQFNRSFDVDGVVGFYLTNPAPGTTIQWGLWDSQTGNEIVTAAKNGLNSMDYSDAPTTQPYIQISGAFRGFGSADQTEDLIGALTQVSGWNDTIGSTSARYAFKNATHLTYVAELPEGITDASYAFQNAGSRAGSTLHIGNWTAENVTTMAHMFEGATTFHVWSLEWSTSKVTDMSHMFDGATAFNAVISGWDTSNVTDMTAMFRNASSFRQNLSGWNVAAVTAHDDFGVGSGMTEAQMPIWADASRATPATPPVTEPDTPEEPDGGSTPDDKTVPDDETVPDGKTTPEPEPVDPQPVEPPNTDSTAPEEEETS